MIIFAHVILFFTIKDCFQGLAGDFCPRLFIFLVFSLITGFFITVDNYISEQRKWLKSKILQK